MSLLSFALALYLSETVYTAARRSSKSGVVRISDEQVYDLLDDADIAILIAYADGGMRTGTAARNSYYDRRTVSTRLTAIRERVGLNPRDFTDLTRLITIIKEGGARGLLHERR